MKKFEHGQEVILNNRQETYEAIFMPDQKYKIVDTKQQYLIKDENGNCTWVDEDEIH